jgi:hypothetical protein
MKMTTVKGGLYVEAVSGLLIFIIIGVIMGVVLHKVASYIGTIFKFTELFRNLFQK